MAGDLSAGSWLTISERKEISGVSRKKSFLIAVPKKIVPLATDRNRIKRWIREAIRNSDGFPRNTLLLFKVKKKPGKSDYSAVQKTVNNYVISRLNG